MRLISENDDRPREEIEHTRMCYDSTVDFIRALERSGALRLRGQERETIAAEEG
jgi:hypothetical protein